MRILLSFLVALCLLAGAFATEKKVVLGRLGQALKETNIYAKPDLKSKRYYAVKAYEYLVIERTSERGWYKVLLQNGKHGYVYAEKVAELPYEVTSDSKPQASGGRVAGNTTSRSGGSFVANSALNYIGTPYKWGGNDTEKGIDCSAFVKKMYGKIGVALPRTAAEQVKVGTPIAKLEDLKPGDRLYFWSKSRGKIGHTGIYLGNGYFVHSSSGRGGVATDYLGDDKWLKTLVAARR